MKGGKNSLSIYRANILIFFVQLPKFCSKHTDQQASYSFLFVVLCRENLHYFISEFIRTYAFFYDNLHIMSCRRGLKPRLQGAA